MTVKATGYLFDSLPDGAETFVATDESSYANLGFHRNSVARDSVRQAVNDSRPLIEDSRARRQRVALLFGPGSPAAIKAKEMVTPVVLLQDAYAVLAETAGGNRDDAR